MSPADTAAVALSDRAVTTKDGRTLRVSLAGDPDGSPILAHHGSPGGRLLYGPHAEDARRRRALLIGYDRPGFGGSSPHAALEGRQAAERFLTKQREEMLAQGPETLGAALRSLLSPVDRAVFTAGVGEFLFQSMGGALGGGVEGWVEDDLAFASPWGFDPGAIAVPVAVWQGRQDRFVPAAHGEWLAARIPGCETHISADDGHLTLKETRLPAVHAWLLEQGQSRTAKPG